MIAVFWECISYGKWFATFFLRDFSCWQQWYISHIPFWIVAEKLLECEKKIECIWCKKWWHTIMIVCHWNFQRDFSPCKKDAKSNLKSTCALNYSSSHLQCNALSLYLSYNISSQKMWLIRWFCIVKGKGFHHLPFWHQTAGDKNGLR